jgi:hypothetical protein
LGFSKVGILLSSATITGDDMSMTEVRVTFTAAVHTDYVPEVSEWLYNGAAFIPGVRNPRVSTIPSLDDDDEVNVLLDFECDSPTGADIRAIDTFLTVEDSIGNTIPECVLIFQAVLHR